MSNQPVRVAIAILHSSNQFLLQLRDNIPDIIYPGHWGLFGGHLEPGETPFTAVQRELNEEIGYCPTTLSEFSCYPDANVVRYVYHAALAVEAQLVLNEGWDMSLLSPQQIRQGSSYSVKAAQVMPIAPPTQRILIDFLNWKQLS